MPNSVAAYQTPEGTAGALAHVKSYDTATSPGIVIDRITGLQWQRSIAAGSGIYSWVEARNFCAALSLDGTAIWRVPTRVELFSIVDTSRANPAIDTLSFGDDAPAEVFWSASPLVGDPGAASAWAVNFTSGIPSVEDVLNPHQVRCVR